MTGILILAAGESARLGQPKQNLIFKDRTLLQRAVETAFASICQPIIVMLGANEALIRPTINQYPVKIFSNADWGEGIASSIRLGVKELKLMAGITSVILMLCDQPFITTSLLNELAERGADANIVACAYNGTRGVPVLFSSAYFDEILQLTGDEGAKKLLLKYSDEVTTIPFQLGDIDIDTMEDFERSITIAPN